MRYGFNYNEGELKGKNEKIKKRNDRKNLYRGHFRYLALFPKL